MDFNLYQTGRDAIITIVIGYLEMQQRVKEETSHLGFRIRDKNGRTMLDDYVLDEAFDTRFRALWYAAQGELARYLCAYTKNMPTPSTFIQTTASSQDDYIIQLVMPACFNDALASAVGFKTEDFVEAYIVWRWLETKLPEHAQFYGARAKGLGAEINEELNKRDWGIERNGAWY